MALGVPPFYHDDREVLFENVLRGPVVLPNWMTPELKDFLSKLLAKDPLDRLGSGGSEEVKAHPWMRKVDWKNVLNRGLDMPQPELEKINLNSIKVNPFAKSCQSDETNLPGWTFIEDVQKHN